MLIVIALFTFLAISTRVPAQQTLPGQAASVTGTYGLATHQMPSPTRDGCWLEATPVTPDMLHVQLRCRMPAPGHHLGVFDAHLPFRSGAVTYEREDAGRCRITIRFVDAQAIVTQAGTDRACGFGASVDVGGTYRRVSSRDPRFDLAPIEKAAEPESAVIVHAAEVRSIADRPDTAIAYDSVARVVSAHGEYNLGVAVVRRQRDGDVTPPDALAHHDIAEVYQIVEGRGLFVSGGRITGGAEMAPDSRGVRRVVGPSFRGTAIVDGTSSEVGPGDIIVVPPDTPHGFSRLISPRIVYTVVRIDPRHRLPIQPAP